MPSNDVAIIETWAIAPLALTCIRPRIDGSQSRAQIKWVMLSASSTRNSSVESRQCLSSPLVASPPAGWATCALMVSIFSTLLSTPRLRNLTFILANSARIKALTALGFALSGNPSVCLRLCVKSSLAPHEPNPGRRQSSR